MDEFVLSPDLCWISMRRGFGVSPGVGFVVVVVILSVIWYYQIVMGSFLLLSPADIPEHHDWNPLSYRRYTFFCPLGGNAHFSIG